jgi:hypothetical protein
MRNTQKHSAFTNHVKIFRFTKTSWLAVFYATVRTLLKLCLHWRFVAAKTPPKEVKKASSAPVHYLGNMTKNENIAVCDALPNEPNSR